MCYVLSEVASLVAKRWLLDLLIMLLVQDILDVFVYRSIESLNHCPISPFKTIIGFPSTDLHCCAGCYGMWICVGRLNWLYIVWSWILLNTEELLWPCRACHIRPPNRSARRIWVTLLPLLGEGLPRDTMLVYHEFCWVFVPDTFVFGCFQLVVGFCLLVIHLFIYSNYSVQTD